MASPLDDVCCASIPAEALRLLAAIRCEPGVKVNETGPRVWVRWEAGNTVVLRAVTPIPECRLFVWRAERWFPLGKHLPDEVPATDYRPLDQVLYPAAVNALPAPVLEGKPALLTLVGEDKPRPATALRCLLADLLSWVDTVPNVRLSRLRATYCEEDVLVLGRKLPELAHGRRYWGQTVLVPLGSRVEPPLPESGLRSALGLQAQELAVFEADHVDVIPAEAFTPLTRAGLRLEAVKVLSPF